MPSHSSLDSPLHGSGSIGVNKSSARFVHPITEAGRLLPSAGRWNSIEINCGLNPSSRPNDSSTSIAFIYTKSFKFNLIITDRKCFKRFIFSSLFLVFSILVTVLLLKYLPHKHGHNRHWKDLTLALKHSLAFFDAQRSGHLPWNNTVKFRGDSGLQDGNSGDIHVDLVGGFYDSGNNIKFGLPTAYTVTLLSWSVIEYHQKYAAIGELDHVKDIIRWGSKHLLKLFVPSNSTSNPSKLYSQVGSSNVGTINDIKCWQRPEDMMYPRPVSFCTKSASDLAGEIAAALASASLVFKQDWSFSLELIQAAEVLFSFATDNENLGTYTTDATCGAEARKFYNSSGYLDELVWGGTWLFFATGNASYLRYATETFLPAMDAELTVDKGVFYWNNKLAASAVLLTRLRYLRDPGYAYKETLESCSNMTNLLMCSYLSLYQNFGRTPGGLILLRPNSAGPLQFAAAAAFLAKVYKDYLDILRINGGTCSAQPFSLQMLQTFSSSQVEYILGKNPLKMSYLVGFGDHFPGQVHHRSASIPWDDQRYSCAQGERWLHSKVPNPNVLIGAMVAGPDQDDKFLDKRDMPGYTEPSISGNAGLVAALIALHDPPPRSSSSNDINAGIDEKGIFANIHALP